MILTAKWNGRCAECGEPTKQGDEIEYADKKAYHPACYKQPEDEAPGPEAYATAERLGYKQIDWHALFLLLTRFGGEPGRDERAARSDEYPIQAMRECASSLRGPEEDSEE